METDQTIDFVPLVGFENDYEIMQEYPFMIRNKHTGKILKESECGTGYVRLTLNGKQYTKHRIIAKQFISNPNGYDEVDHINHNKTDNRIENLRWVSHSENNKNKSSRNGLKYNYVDILPDDAFEIEYYDTKNGRRFLKDYYYSPINDEFYYDVDIGYRILLKNNMYGSEMVSMRDVNNKSLSFMVSRFKQQQGMI